MTGKAVEQLDNYLNKDQENAVHILPRESPDRTMLAAAWRGKKSIKVEERPVPLLTDPTDVVIKVTATAICGSDLHLYLKGVAGMKSGDILGHEPMGVVEQVGPEVKNVKVGDRVVIAFDLGCGHCYYCNHQLFSSCNSTNPSKVQEAMYGDACGGFLGYSHLTGGWPGGQAEYLRVPFADVNCLKVPDSLTDEQVLFLSDILPTAWHGCELGEVHEGDNVAIWGAGPVGQLAAQCARHRGAKQVFLIDSVPYRLEFAKATLGADIHTINFKDTNVIKTLKELTEEGPDVCIDCTGSHYATNLLHKVEYALQLELDTPEIVNECVEACRKGGRISVIAAYIGYVNHFNLGAFMEKQLTMRGGQTPCQKYWPTLLEKVKTGALDPTKIITHKLPLEEAADGYHVFNEKTDNCIKVVLYPGGVPAKSAGVVAH